MLTLENYILTNNINETFDELNDDVINEGIILNAIKKVWNWITGKPKKKSKDSYYGGRSYYGGGYYDGPTLKRNKKSKGDDNFDYDGVKKSQQYKELTSDIPKGGVKTSGSYIVKQSSIQELKDIVAKNTALSSVVNLTDTYSNKSALQVNRLADKDDNTFAIVVFSELNNFADKYNALLTDDYFESKSYKVTKDNTILLVAMEYDDSIKPEIISELVLSCIKGNNKENIIVTEELSKTNITYILMKLYFQTIKYNGGRVQFVNIAEMINRMKDDM